MYCFIEQNTLKLYIIKIENTMEAPSDPSIAIAEKIIRDLKISANPQVSRAPGGPVIQASPTPGKGSKGPAKKK